MNEKHIKKKKKKKERDEMKEAVRPLANSRKRTKKQLRNAWGHDVCIRN